MFVVVGVAHQMAVVMLLTRGRAMPAVVINLAAIAVRMASSTVGLQAAALVTVALPRRLPTGRLGAVSVIDLQSHDH